MNSDNPGSCAHNTESRCLMSLNNTFLKFYSCLNWKKASCVFTLSTGRSGTLTLVKLLDLSPKIHAIHEPDPKLLDEFHNAFYEIWENPNRYQRLFKGARKDIIGQALWMRKIYAEGAIMKYFAPVISEIMPNSKFLYCYRHPGGVVRSGMRRGWYQGHIFDKYKLAPLKTDPVYERWQTWDAFAKNCWMWKTENEFFLKFINSVGNKRALKVPFEEFIDPENNFSQKLFKFIGVASPKHDQVFNILKAQHNKQKTGDFPEFRRWSDEQKRTLYEIAGNMMQRLGYE